MRTRSAIEFCGLWKKNIPDFTSIELDAFKTDSGLNSLPFHHKSGLKRLMQKALSQSPGDTEALLSIEISLLNL